MATESTELRLRNNRDFRLLTAGELSAALGQGTARFALPLAVLFYTGSAAVAGVVAAMEVGGSVAVGLYAGAVIDRIHRKRALLCAIISRLLLWTSVVVAGTFGVFNPVHLGGVALLSGVAGAFAAPAERTALRTIVPSAVLPRALAVNEGRNAAASLASAPLGGLLIAIDRVLPFASAAVMLLLAAIFWNSIRTDLGVSTKSTGRTTFTDMKHGLRFVSRHSGIRSTLIACAVLNIANATFMFVLVVHLAQQGMKPWVVGIVVTAAPIGLIVGATLSPLVLRGVRIGALIACLFGAFAACYVLVWTFPDQAVLAGILLFLSCVLLPPMNVAVESYTMRVTPVALTGRITSISETVSFALMPIAPLVGGLLIDAVDSRAGLAVAAAVAIAAFALVVLDRSVRRIPRLDAVEESALL